jgi:phage tail-like protein
MYPTRYANLRDRRHWEATLTAFSADGDGVLSLTTLPMPRVSVRNAEPYAAPASGLATGACCDLFVADTANDALWYLDQHCATEARVGPNSGLCLGGARFNAPRGLAFGRDGLYVVDSGSARVLLLRAPDLRLSRIVLGPWTQPWQIAVDDARRLYVLDQAGPRMVRLDARGKPDNDYNVALAAHATQPLFLAVRGDGVLHVSDGAANSVLRFTDDGALLEHLPAPLLDWKPRALAVRGTRCYVADEVSGQIYAYDDGVLIGAVPGYVGAVSALAIGSDGSLYIKPGADREFVVACADAGVAAQGELRAGPLDAGEGDDWQRVVLDIALEADASVALDVFCAPDTSLPPADNEWLRAPAHDVLLSTMPNMPLLRAGRRYLWMRVRAQSGLQGANLRLHQLRAVTQEEAYLRHLPAIYAEQDADTVLERFLALARSELRAGEMLIEDLPRLAHPDFLPERDLPWLARWLAFELPEGLSGAERRALLARAWALYRTRGTVAGLLQFVHVYTGARARLVEWHAQHRVWQLGVTSALGFDTALPSASAEGIVVADAGLLAHSEPAQGCAVPERVVVGHAVVGVDRPQASNELGAALFDDTAHRISVLVPAYQAPSAALRAIVEETVAAEAPAHVQYEVCFVEPRLRIGVQARLGIDTLIAGEGGPLRLTQTRLGQDSRLGGDDAPGIGIGQNARIGHSLALG